MGGLEGVDPEAIRVPIYGLTDSGRGFWLQLDDDARGTGFCQSHLPSVVFSSWFRRGLRCSHGFTCG